MRRSGFWGWREIVLAVVLAAGGRPSAAGPAFAIVDLQTGATVAAVDGARLDVAIPAGSTMKIATLVALLESNTIRPATRIACTRTARIGAHSYPCSHPDLHRPLTAAEALAHSCNSFFAAAATRLPRQALDSACATLGLSPPSAHVDIREAALGLGGAKQTPRQLLEALRRVAADARLPIRETTRQTLLEGLRGAATFGTAAAFAEHGLDALAKTGSAGGTPQYGLVVAVTPASRPTRGIVVLVPGGAGRDAAAIAAEQLKKHAARSAEPVKARGSREESGGVPGTIRVGFARANGGNDVQTVDFEEYVARVIAGEAAARSPDAALDALAITIRTFAAANPGRHARDGFDVCDLTHCQVVRSATEATRSAALRTRGRVLRYHGVPAPVYYTASCGGRSELPSAVWPGHADLPFLPSHADPACAGAPAWAADITADDLLRALHAAGFEGDRLRDVRVTARTGSGRAATIQLRGVTPPVISGQDLRIATGRTLGWNLIKSAAFELTRTAAGYRFTGKGSGHGVGLCVIGSVNMALDGASADAILATYFPGISADPIAASAMTDAVVSASAAVRSVAGSNVKIMMSVAEEPLRGMVENLTQHLWITISGRAIRGASGAATFRFHPTVESYRRATGQPWWVAATTRGREIDLLPIAVLRDRGILEQTIAHEIAHVVTAPALEGRSLWVKEGAAIYFAGEQAATPRSKAKCPSDGELAHSTSAGALRDAYGRAAACFANRIAAGEDWRAIR